MYTDELYKLYSSTDPLNIKVAAALAKSQKLKTSDFLPPILLKLVAERPIPDADERFYEIARQHRFSTSKFFENFGFAGFGYKDLSELFQTSKFRIQLAKSQLNHPAHFDTFLALRPRLTWLNANQSGFTQTGLLSDCPMLEELHLEANNLTNAQLPAIAAIKSLRVLYLSNNPITSLAALSGMHNLRELRFNLYSALSKPNQSAAAILDGLSGLRGLKSLSLRGQPLSELLPLLRFSTLEYLDISDTSISDLSLISGLPNLKTLYCSNIPARDLSPLAQHPRLQQLQIHLVGLSDQLRSLRAQRPELVISLQG